MDRYDVIEEVEKFNPYHDSLGKFSTSNGYASFTFRTKDPKKQHWADMAVAREQKRSAAAQAAAKPKVKPKAQPQPKPKPTAQQTKPQQPAGKKDRLGFSDYDAADYHQLHSGAKYYAQQKLTAKQKQAAARYLESDTEPGSLYSHSQNLNYRMATGQPITGNYKQTHDGLMSAMHNLGYNVNLSRYDHPDMVNGILRSKGIGKDYDKMTASQLKKALVGTKVGENKFISTSYNDFANAPASSKNVFTTRAVKVTYKAKAGTQAMMPGDGPGGKLGEVILAPTSKNPGTITDVKFTGVKARRKGTQLYNQPQVEITIEI